MTIHYQADNVVLHHGDCIEVMASLPANSVDAVVTDPPYGLEFMGKGWDGANGFRRSLNARVDGRTNGKEKATVSVPEAYVAGSLFQEWSQAWATEALRVLKPGGHLLAFGGTRTWHRLAVAVEDAGFEIRDSLAWMHGQGFPKGQAQMKPAFEPVVMGRKPFKGSMVANVAAHGTGALQVDATRIGYEPADLAARTARTGSHAGEKYGHNGTVKYSGGEVAAPNVGGRWPANVMLDEDMAAALDQQSGTTKSVRSNRGELHGEIYGGGKGPSGPDTVRGHNDSGGASRFFYVAKASANERPKFDGVAHPTVKPLDLMQWLIRLVTPPGGTVLEPFAGSGTTAEAALREGFSVIAIEKEADYLPLIVARVSRPMSYVLDFGDGVA